MILLLILTLVLLALNIWYFLRRSWEDSYYPTSYATLFYPEDRPVVRKCKMLKKRRVEMELNWNAPVTGWEISVKGEHIETVRGPNPIFQIPDDKDELKSFTAVPQPPEVGNPLHFNIWFRDSELIAAQGMSGPDRCIVRTETPIGKFKQYPVSSWVDTYDYLDRETLEETDRILKEEADIREDDGVIEKLDKLMIFYRRTIGKECRGMPRDELRPMNPFQVYQELKSGKAKGYCLQHAQVYSYFANRAGLSTRWVQGARTQSPGNTFVFTGHTWLEAYIPEQECWAWVEPSHGTILAKDKLGQYLNTVELANLRMHEAFDGVVGRVYKDWEWPDLEGEEGTIVEAPFAECSQVVQRQFMPCSIFKWRRPPVVEDIRCKYGQLLQNKTFFWGNLIRYYFKPPLAYALFPTEGKQIYFIRNALLWGFLASLLATLVAL